MKESPQKGKGADPAVVEPPAAPAIPDSPLHLAAKAGNAEKVLTLCAACCKLPYARSVLVGYSALSNRSLLFKTTTAAQREELWGQVAQLLERGEDPTVLDARGKPPYAVAADKDVRDAFRRYVANEDALPWDWTAAGVPSALTPEMEAQQAARQARAPISESLSSCSAASGNMTCALQ